MRSASFRLLTVGLVVLAAFILRDVLFFGRAFFERDLTLLYVPPVEAFVRALTEGALPLRDTSVGFGQPLLADPAAQILYPLSWSNLFLLPDQAYTLMVLAHLLIGGCGAAALCFRLSGSIWASFFAGAFWMASGPFQSLLNLWHHFAGASWMPWVLLQFDRLLETPSLRRVLVLGGVFGIQILAGSADMCAMTALLAGVRLLCEGRRLATAIPRRVAMIGAAMALAVSLGAGVWLPALEIVKNSRRAAFTREARTEWSVHPIAAAEFVIPAQVGTLPWNAETLRQLSGGRPPFLVSLFLGVLALPLCVSGLMNSGASRRHRVFLGVGALGMALGALGKYSPVYDIAIGLMPPMAIFRYPSKATVPVSLLVSVLSGLGVRALTERRERFVVGGISGVLFLIEGGLSLEASRLLAPLVDPAALMVSAAISRVSSGLAWSAVVLLALAVSSIVGRFVLVRGCALVALGLTLFIGRDLNVTVDHDAVRFRPGHVALMKDTEPSRLYAFPYLLHPEQLPKIFTASSGISAENYVLLQRSALMAPIGGIWNLEYGWDVDQRGLLDRTLSDLTRFMNGAPTGENFVRMLRLGNVARVVDVYKSDLQGLTLEHTVPLLGPQSLYVYRVSDPLPRAYAVSGARPLDPSRAQASLLDPAFDPHVEVLLGADRSAAVSPSFRSTVRIKERRSDRTALDVTLSESGFVVLLEGFLPGWQATLDGEAVPVRRANALFLAAETPAGRHTVVFNYRPWSALVGVSLTAFTALSLIVALFVLRNTVDRTDS